MGLLVLGVTLLLSFFFGYSSNSEKGRKIAPIMQQSVSLMGIGLSAFFLSWFLGASVMKTIEISQSGDELLLWFTNLGKILISGSQLTVIFKYYSYLEISIISVIILIITYRITMSGYVWFSNIQDKEIWNGYILKAEFHEWWIQEYTVQEAYTVIEDGKTVIKYKTVTKERDVNPFWKVITSLGTEVYISESQFTNYVNKFGNKEYIYISRSDRVSGKETGNKYVTSFDGTDEKLVPHAEVRDYINYIQGAPQTLLKTTGNYNNYKTHMFEPVTIVNSKFGSIDVDRVHSNDVNLPEGWREEVDLLLSKWLAYNASEKQVNFFVIVTHRPESIYYAYHKKFDGSNKNEVILLMGVDENLQLTWNKVMSLSDEHLFREKIAQRLRDLKDVGSNPESVARILTEEVQTGFKRKTMSSLVRLASRIRLPLTGTFVVILLTLIMSSGLFSYFFYEDLLTDLVEIGNGIKSITRELLN